MHNFYYSLLFRFYQYEPHILLDIFTIGFLVKCYEFIVFILHPIDFYCVKTLCTFCEKHTRNLIYLTDRQLTSVTAEETTLVGVNTDESLTLTAEVESLRQPNIRWSFESEDLQVDGKYNM